MMVFQEIAMVLKLLRTIWKVEELASNSVTAVLDVILFLHSSLCNLSEISCQCTRSPRPAALSCAPGKSAELWNTPITTSSIAVAPA